MCRRTADNNPVNSAGYSCYDSATSQDFPANAAVNQNLATGRAGTTSGGIQLGDVRVMVAVDYALGQNFLAGARLGYVFNAYPGKRASHFAPVHIEARGTYLFGHAPLARSGLAPMVFVGLGLSEFDGHQATLVNYITNMSQAVDVWATDAPFFITVGGGVRYQIATRAALTRCAWAARLSRGQGLHSCVRRPWRGSTRGCAARWRLRRSTRSFSPDSTFFRLR